MTQAGPAHRRMPITLRRAGVFAMIAVAATAGLLIWGRLRLVAGVPRTALAEPRQLVPPVQSGSGSTTSGDATPKPRPDAPQRDSDELGSPR